VGNTNFYFGGKFKHSVNKTAADVLDQLRLLRCFDNTITQCVGFTFPKFATDGNQNKSCVVKVTVSFKNFQFQICLSSLHISDVKREVEAEVLRTKNFRLMVSTSCA